MTNFEKLSAQQEQSHLNKELKDKLYTELKDKVGIELTEGQLASLSTPETLTTLLSVTEGISKDKEAGLRNIGQKYKDIVTSFSYSDIETIRPKKKPILSIKDSDKTFNIYGNQFGLIAGAGGTGKGIWLLRFILATLKGLFNAPDDITPIDGKVLYISGEDDKETILERIQSNNLEYSYNFEENLLIYSLIDNPEGGLFNIEGNETTLFSTIEQAIKAENVKLIIIDPLSQFMPPDFEKDNGIASVTLGKLQALLKANDAAGILVHHITKEGKSSLDNAKNVGALQGINAIRGASAIVDGVRWAGILADPFYTNNEEIEDTVRKELDEDHKAVKSLYFRIVKTNNSEPITTYYTMHKSTKEFTNDLGVPANQSMGVYIKQDKDKAAYNGVLDAINGTSKKSDNRLNNAAEKLVGHK